MKSPLIKRFKKETGEEPTNQPTFLIKYQKCSRTKEE